MAWLALVGGAALPLFWIPFAQIEVTRNDAQARCPETITFHLAASASNTIGTVELEFGTDAQACGESISRIVPGDFQRGSTVTTEWTWDLRRTGALPPGTTVWWRWILRDVSGAELITPDQQLSLEDTRHTWQERTSGLLQLYWYEGTPTFAQGLLDAGEDALATIRMAMGVHDEGEIRLYIYANPSAMQSATLFAPDWSGGLAFPQHRAVLIAVAPSELEWGKRTVAHELTHVVIGQYSFSCLNSTPPWVDEGLAMFTEGDLDPGLAGQLDDAIRQGTLLPTRSLGEVFSNDPARARLAYAQSFSLVSFLIEEHGPEKMVRFLDQFRQGASIDRALQGVYSIDLDGLEAAWRAAKGAPAVLSTTVPEENSTRTPYPTYAPLGGPNSLASTVTPPPVGQPANQEPTTGRCGLPAAVGAVGLALILVPRRQRAGGRP